MKGLPKTVLRAAIIAAVASLIGIGLNVVSPRGLPWIHARPSELVVGEVRIPLIDVAKAHEFLEDGETMFVDTRDDAEYSEGHVRGALSLPEPNKEERFPSVQPLLDEEGRIILYCSGPECEMAEKTAYLLVQLGYRSLMIMSDGFPAWQKAGYPVEGSTK